MQEHRHRGGGRRLDVSGTERWKGCPLSELSNVPALPEAKSDLFRSLGHPVRIRVLELLADGPVRVSELRKATDLEASNLSQHLGVLRRQRLIASSRTDGQIHYRLSCPEVLPLLTVASPLLRNTLHSTRLQLFEAGAPERES
jgi:DNA-binding transcriptional ArsR family regulator